MWLNPRRVRRAHRQRRADRGRRGGRHGGAGPSGAEEADWRSRRQRRWGHAVDRPLRRARLAGEDDERRAEPAREPPEVPTGATRMVTPKDNLRIWQEYDWSRGGDEW